MITTDDRLAIHELLATYARAIDTERWDDLPALFTGDGRLEFGPMGAFEGRDGIARFAGILAGIPNFMRHFVTNVVIVGDGTAARVDCYVLAMTGSNPGALSPSTGFYEDEVAKQDGRWLFRSRRILLDGSS